MQNNLFMIINYIGLFIASIIRKIFTRGQRQESIRDDRISTAERVLTPLPLLGMLILPLIYTFTDWLDFANYTLPDWAGWLGVGVYLVFLWLLYRSHVDLGRNWSPSLQVRQEHSLVTQGVFRYMRHPMYSAHLVWGLAQPLLLHNWIAGFSLLISQLPLYIARIPREEKMMLENFGDEYRTYMKRTGSVFPAFWKSGR